MSEHLRTKVLDAANMVIGMIPASEEAELSVLDESIVRQINAVEPIGYEPDDVVEVITGTVKIISTYDSSAKSEVSVAVCGLITDDDPPEQDSIAIIWDEHDGDDILIGLGDGSLWTFDEEGRHIDSLNDEVVTKALGAFAAIADSLL